MINLFKQLPYKWLLIISLIWILVPCVIGCYYWQQYDYNKSELLNDKYIFDNGIIQPIK